jgi:hypothetical protein
MNAGTETKIAAHALNLDHVRKALSELGLSREGVREIVREIVTESIDKYFASGQLQAFVIAEIDKKLKWSDRTANIHATISGAVENAVRREITTVAEAVAQQVRQNVRLAITVDNSTTSEKIA